MLKKLRRKLVAIIMVLVGAVLMGVIGMSVMSSISSLDDLVERSLNKVLLERGDTPQDEDSLSSAGHLSVVWVDMSDAGVMLGTNQSKVSIDADKLEIAITDAISSTNTKGSISEYHLTWKKGTTPFGSRIVIADTSTIDASRLKVLLSALWIGIVAFVGLFILANVLSNWALKPVEEAWQQQHQFIADASHELKTPLAVIIANSQILKEHEEDLPEADRRWITSTQEEAQHMKGLVEEMLELARTEEGAGSNRRNINVDLSDVVEGAAIQFDAVAFERGCEIDSSSIEENLHVMGDPDQLERLTKTLIDNAIKYATNESTVTVELTRQTTFAQLMVRNLGTPIDQEDIEHVFDRFYRSDKARSRETGGFGLGLAIARGIAESHGGKIWVTSTQADGTRFFVKIPLVQKG